MLKKTITYTDYDGVSRTEDYFFNLSKSELAEMQMSVDGGLDKMLKKIIDTKNVPEIMKVFKEIILKSYGEKSPDGKYFKKSEDISTAFMQTEAYTELYMEILSNPDFAISFINGIIPSSVREEVQKELPSTQNA